MARVWLCILCFLTFSGTAWAQARLEAHALPVGGGEAGQSQELAVTREEVRTVIDDQYADTVIDHVFTNNTDTRMEGRYVIALGEGARVHGFAYWNGEEKIVGEVFERDTARQVYEQVAGLGRDPGLLEQVGEGAFAFRVFPIEPHESKRIEIRFGRRLSRVGHVVEYRLPLSGGEGDVDVTVHDHRHLIDLRSPTHTVSVDSQPDGARVRGRVAAGTDHAPFVLRYAVDEPEWQLSAQAHKDPGEDAYVTLQVASPQRTDDTVTPSKDVTLVLDRSGSMSGEPLAQARSAAEAVVQRLGAADRVNVMTFDDGVNALYDRPRELTDAVRTDALSFIQRVREGGGTDIALALGRALRAQHDDARPHIVLFVTDGQSDRGAAIAEASSDQRDARVFTVGVGSGVEKPLLARIAGLKRGRFAYIPDVHAIESSIVRVFEQMEHPLLLDLSLEAEGGAMLDTYPRTLPDLVPGDELVIHTRVHGSGPIGFTLRGKVGGKPVELKTKIAVADGERRPWVGRLWAESRVDDLLEDIALSGETEERKNEATRLALAYNFTTPYTSFLAIPERELTALARGTLEQARDLKRQIQKAHSDAAALSRDDMPPGDPILTVHAPRDATQVTAYFAFGLVKDLAWDERIEAWQLRFLVPKGVVDGVYRVKVLIVRADGSAEIADVPYTIDSADPEFEVEVDPLASGVRVRVSAKEAIKEAVVVSADHPRRRAVLRDNGHGVLEGTLPLSAGPHVLRVVVADAARNEAEKTVNALVRGAR